MNTRNLRNRLLRLEQAASTDKAQPVLVILDGERIIGYVGGDGRDKR